MVYGVKSIERKRNSCQTPYSRRHVEKACVVQCHHHNSPGWFCKPLHPPNEGSRFRNVLDYRQGDNNVKARNNIQLQDIALNKQNARLIRIGREVDAGKIEGLASWNVRTGGKSPRPQPTSTTEAP